MLGPSSGSGDIKSSFMKCNVCPAEAKPLMVTDPLSAALVNLAFRIMALIPVA